MDIFIIENALAFNGMQLSVVFCVLCFVFIVMDGVLSPVYV